MKTRTPTSREIEELVAFLPLLSADGFTPIRGWRGGTKGQNGVFVIPHTEYDEIVKEFFRIASCECWSDYDYRSEEAGRMLKNDAVVRSASLDQIKKMLIYFVRGERFCNGQWGAMIEGGYVRRLLLRLAELGSRNG